MPVYESIKNADNKIKISANNRDSVVFAWDKVIAALAEKNAKTIAIDGWYGIDYAKIAKALAAKLEAQGKTPAYIAVGAAAAIHRYLNENEKTQTVENAVLVLQEVSGLQAEETLSKMILDCYGKLIGGATIRELCTLADNVKAASLNGII